MRAPDDGPPGNPPQRAGRNYESDLSLRYLAPGAFTILPPDEPPPNPPPAPPSYRLTPTTRRNRNQAFAILADSTSNPGSRSPSPTGRVSPFRGRGFNPAGSRHASPTPSPPPPLEGYRISSRNNSPRRSQIPQLSRRGNSSVFGEKVTHGTSPFRRKDSTRLSPHLSKSLSSIEPKRVSYKPPPSPRRTGAYGKTSAFQRLSPISGSGSSPEPSADQPKSSSSPSRIPQRSRSQPPSSRSYPASRQPSPSRKQTGLLGKPPTRGSSRPSVKNSSRNVSREPSPNKLPTSPTRKNYKNVQAKVNSFSKPKVPPKPDVLPKSTKDKPTKINNDKPKIDRKESVKKINNNNNVGKTNGTSRNNNSNSNNKSASGSNSVNNAKKAGASEKNNKDNKNGSKANQTTATAKMNGKDNKENENSMYDYKTRSNKNSSDDLISLSSLLQPSATTVVSSTTSTAAKPLKIDAKIESSAQCDSSNPKVTPIVDGRVLSATSVSNAINKMNDTVLNTKTLMKDTSFSKLSPAASAIISMSNKSNSRAKASMLSTVQDESTEKFAETESSMTTLKEPQNMVTSQGIPAPVMSSTENKNDTYTKQDKNCKTVTLDTNINNNMNKGIISDQQTVGLGMTTQNNNSMQKSSNDRLIEARTVVAADVKPIKIMVKEKPSELEVQSGNVRIPVSSTNGISERPGLPPPQQQQIEQAEPETKSKNVCTRFMASCKKKMSCKRKKTEEKKEDKDGKTGCFNCRKKAKLEETPPTVTTPAANKTKFFDRLKCCKKNKVSDTGCCPRGKRKDSWVERRDSILSEPLPKRSRCTKLACKNALRRMCCLNMCRKKKIERVDDSRRTSVMSKKKSLTPTAPPEEPKPKLDLSLVEHTSHMKAAIPVLPVPLAWFCLICNVFLPGTGTIFSGLLCLCLGKPRFSQKDGPKPRIGAFLIDLIIGCGQLFTVLFCLVGWGWSIWWGVIMLKVARKHRKIKMAEKMNREGQQIPVINQNNLSRDVERGS